MLPIMLLFADKILCISYSSIFFIDSTQETFGIQNPAASDVAIMQENANVQGTPLDATASTAPVEGEAIASGHPPIGQAQGQTPITTEIPQGKSKYTIL
jgi:hypothetical protein